MPERILQRIIKIDTTESNYLIPRPEVQISEQRDGFILDIHKNPTALATLRLLCQINDSASPLSEAEIIEKRVGGIYPTRTVEEINLLNTNGLINNISENPNKFIISNLGSIELSLNNVIGPEHVNRRLNAALSSVINEPPVLPPEKYGNEEFRFTWESVYKLMKSIYEDNAYRNIDIALLGSPLIGVFMSRCPDIFNNISVFDINQDMVKLINKNHNGNGKIIASCYDALIEFPRTLVGRYDAFIMDPPWHNEHYCLFVDRAWDALRSLGRVYMSTFAPETRPEASEELRYLYDRFMKGGFALISIVPEFFGYAIPAYERLVFQAEGIQANSRGNYGQLVVLERRQNRNDICLTEELVDKLIIEKNIELKGKGDQTLTLWLENVIESDTLKAPLNLTLLNAGEVYTTTSRSQRRKDGVNILTNKQVAYNTTNPYKLSLIYGFWSLKIDLEECLEKMRDHKIFTNDNDDKILSDIKLAFSFFEKVL